MLNQTKKDLCFDIKLDKNLFFIFYVRILRKIKCLHFLVLNYVVLVQFFEFQMVIMKLQLVKIRLLLIMNIIGSLHLSKQIKINKITIVHSDTMIHKSKTFWIYTLFFFSSLILFIYLFVYYSVQTT